MSTYMPTQYIPHDSIIVAFTEVSKALCHDTDCIDAFNSLMNRAPGLIKEFGGSDAVVSSIEGRTFYNFDSISEVSDNHHLNQSDTALWNVMIAWIPRPPVTGFIAVDDNFLTQTPLTPMQRTMILTKAQNLGALLQYNGQTYLVYDYVQSLPTDQSLNLTPPQSTMLIYTIRGLRKVMIPTLHSSFAANTVTGSTYLCQCFM